jgi:hydroxyethylthiazole kinase-like uncharacterized protein yjeF
MTMKRAIDINSITVAEMRALEKKAFEKGASALELMERAGKECARLIEEKRGTGKMILVFCGPGNNGGDGLVCSRYLAEKNDVTIVMPLEPKTKEAITNFELAKAAGLKFAWMSETPSLKPDIIVDALLGVGAKPGLRGAILDACMLINSFDTFTIAIDVPTGMDADSGECYPEAVIPNATICIHAPKTGEMKAGATKTGLLWVADVGL